MTDNVTPIPVKFKNSKETGKMLTVVKSYGCVHHAYVIDPDGNEVTCSICNRTFSPMSALVDLSHKESLWMQHHDRYEEEKKRLEERSRTKCDNCGKMTRISHS
jgi:radical SAM protein with 4Fe4S-binding SPASM domain